MEQAVAFMVGVVALVAGISMLWRREAWAGWLRMVRLQGAPMALMLGYMHVVIGAFILGFHWRWEGLSLVITLLGVKAVAEGVTYMFFPQSLGAMLAWYEPRMKTTLTVGGIVCLIIAAVAYQEWMQAAVL